MKEKYNEMTYYGKKKFIKKLFKIFVLLLLFIFGVLAENDVFGEFIHLLVDGAFWFFIFIILPLGADDIYEIWFEDFK